MRRTPVPELLDYARTTLRRGAPVSRDPILRDLLVRAYIDAQVNRLLEARDWRIYDTGKETTYHSSQTALWAAEASVRLAFIVSDVLGPYAMLDASDPLSPIQGRFASIQRSSIAAGTDADWHREVIGAALGFSAQVAPPLDSRFRGNDGGGGAGMTVMQRSPVDGTRKIT